MQKVCFKCGATKPLDDFYKHPKMADGHLGKCKTCTKKDVQDRYDSKPDLIREYEKARFQTPKRKAKVVQYQRSRRAREPLKYAANLLTSNAIKDGRLTRQPCEICGKEKSEAHHRDYCKPLEVVWLCRKHHLAEHNKKSWTDT